MVNFLSETLEVLEKNGKKESDVLWVGYVGDYYFNWRKFKELSDKKYDNSYGCENIALELVIVGKSWWLERGEYDGSEWWEFKTYPKKPKTINNKPRFM